MSLINFLTLNINTKLESYNFNFFSEYIDSNLLFVLPNLNIRYKKVMEMLSLNDEKLYDEIEFQINLIKKYVDGISSKKLNQYNVLNAKRIKSDYLFDLTKQIREENSRKKYTDLIFDLFEKERKVMNLLIHNINILTLSGSRSNHFNYNKISTTNDQITILSKMNNIYYKEINNIYYKEINNNLDKDLNKKYVDKIYNFVYRLPNYLEDESSSKMAYDRMNQIYNELLKDTINNHLYIKLFDEFDSVINTLESNPFIKNDNINFKN